MPVALMSIVLSCYAFFVENVRETAISINISFWTDQPTKRWKKKSVTFGVYLRMLSAIVSHRICQSKVTWGEKQFNLLIKKFRSFFFALMNTFCVWFVWSLFFSCSFVDDICYAHFHLHAPNIYLKRAEIRYHCTIESLLCAIRIFRVVFSLYFHLRCVCVSTKISVPDGKKRSISFLVKWMK